MTIFAEIQEKLGNRGTATMPTVDRAIDLLQLVREHNREAFEEVFTIYRFAPPSQNDPDMKADNIIFQAFNEGKVIFTKTESSEFIKG